jgi:hypothetical protein
LQEIAQATVHLAQHTHAPHADPEVADGGIDDTDELWALAKERIEEKIANVHAVLPLPLFFSLFSFFSFFSYFLLLSLSFSFYFSLLLNKREQCKARMQERRSWRT